MHPAPIYHASHVAQPRVHAGIARHESRIARTLRGVVSTIAARTEAATAVSDAHAASGTRTPATTP